MKILTATHKDFMQSIGKPPPDNDQIARVIFEVDANDDGEISFEEFNNWWKSQHRNA